MPRPELFDTHCHLDDEQFNERREDVFTRATEAGIRGIITIGVNASTSRRSVEIASSHLGVLAAVGIQPNYVGEAAADEWEQIVELAKNASAAAIGETGLDRYWKDAPFALQQDYFDRHLRLSRQTDLPFIVHMRNCDADVLEMLREARQRGPLRGAMHSFTGEAATMRECVELGLHISFAGMVTYKKSEALRNIAGEVPDDRILIETDSPYLSPHPMRNQRPNEPALLVHTAACLAEVRGVSLDDFAKLTTRNARDLFRVTG